jgi:hypothetical protein
VRADEAAQRVQRERGEHAVVEELCHAPARATVRARARDVKPAREKVWRRPQLENGRTRRTKATWGSSRPARSRACGARSR